MAVCLASLNLEPKAGASSRPLLLRARKAGIFGKLLAGAVVLIALLVAGNFGTTILAVESAKETHANQRVLADGNGGVLATGEATSSAPLFILHAMDIEQLRRVRHVTVSYNNPDFAGKRVEHSLAIMQHMKVSVEVVLLTDPLGFQVELRGFEVALIKPDGERVPLCGASATCASFEVNRICLKTRL